jgi:hypothetical protein
MVSSGLLRRVALVRTEVSEDSFTFLYVDDVHTSQEIHLWDSTPRCGDRFTFLFVDVRTSPDTHLPLLHSLLLR